MKRARSPGAVLVNSQPMRGKALFLVLFLVALGSMLASGMVIVTR